MKDYNKAIELDSNYAAPYFNRALLYDELGETECAIKDYDKVLKFAPNDVVAYNL